MWENNVCAFSLTNQLEWRASSVVRIRLHMKRGIILFQLFHSSQSIAIHLFLLAVFLYSIMSYIRLLTSTITSRQNIISLRYKNIKWHYIVRKNFSTLSIYHSQAGRGKVRFFDHRQCCEYMLNVRELFVHSCERDGIKTTYEIQFHLLDKAIFVRNEREDVNFWYLISSRRVYMCRCESMYRYWINYFYSHHTLLSVDWMK